MELMPLSEFGQITIGLTVDKTTVVVGTPVTMTAKVEIREIINVPFVDVHFYANGVLLGTVKTDTAGVAVLEATIEPAGVYTIQAKYQARIILAAYSNTVKVTIVDKLTANLSAAPDSGTAPLTTQLTGRIGGGAEPFDWKLDFGDQQSAYGSTRDIAISHTYDKPGTYTALLTVRDALWQDASAALTVTVEEAPAPPPPPPTEPGEPAPPPAEPTHPVVISGATTADMAGRQKTNFTRGETVMLSATYTNVSQTTSHDVLAVVQPLAPDGTIYPPLYSQFSLGPQQSMTFFGNFLVPDDAPTGTYTAEFNAFNDYPANGGAAIAKTVVIQFEVTA